MHYLTIFLLVSGGLFTTAAHAQLPTVGLELTSDVTALEGTFVVNGISETEHRNVDIPAAKFRFTVALSRATLVGESITVPLLLSPQGSGNSRASAEDFESLLAVSTTSNGVVLASSDIFNHTLTFQNAAQSITLELTAVRDTKLEDDQSVKVSLGTPTGAVVDPTSESFTITLIDDEYILCSSQTELKVAEDAGFVSIPLVLSKVLPFDIDVRPRYFQPSGGALSDGGGGEGGDDDGDGDDIDYYVAYSYPQYLTIKAGSAGVILKNRIIDDLAVEGSEDYRVIVNTSVLPIGHIFCTYTVTIEDNDPQVTIAGGDAISEGGMAEFTVRLSAAPPVDVPVTLMVMDAPNSDFIAAANEGVQTVTVLAGDTTATYSFVTINNNQAEATDTISVEIVEPVLGAGLSAEQELWSNYTIGAPALARLEVQDDDVNLEVSITGGNPVDEGTPASFIIQLNQPSSSPLTIDLNVSAVITDYIAAGSKGRQSLVVPAGALRTTYQVPTVDYDTDGSDGEVEVTINPDPNSIYSVTSASVASVTVRGGEVAVNIAAYDQVVQEGYPLSYIIRRDRIQTGALTVNLSVSEVGGDFIAAADQQSVTIAAHQQQAIFTLPTVYDGVSGNDGQVTVVIADPSASFYRKGSNASATAAVYDFACNYASDIDLDDDGLIEVCDLNTLDAMRHQADGSGYRAHAHVAKSTMGCGDGGCRGYELMGSLDFSDAGHYLYPSRSAERSQWMAGGSGWQPIGSAKRPFAATLEGNGETISNLYIADTTVSGGLFGHIAESALIANLALHNVNISAGSKVGAIAGVNAGIVANIDIINGDISGDGNDIGGIIGINRGALLNSNVILDSVMGGIGELQCPPGSGSTVCPAEQRTEVIVSNGHRVGGLVAHNEGRVNDSFATIMKVLGSHRVGGAVGANTTVASIENVAILGAVVGNEQVGGLVGYHRGSLKDGNAIADVSGHIAGVGGLVGSADGGAIINSQADGTVVGNIYVGGLVGDAQASSIYRSYVANAQVSGNEYVGGLVGRMVDGRLSNTYAHTAVHGSAQVGGLVGSNKGYIYNSYTASTVVAGGDNVGGLVGKDNAYASSTTATEWTRASYWDSEVSGLEHSAAGVAKSTSELKTPLAPGNVGQTYAGWDPRIWNFATLNDYPTFNDSIESDADVEHHHITVDEGSRITLAMMLPPSPLSADISYRWSQISGNPLPLPKHRRREWVLDVPGNMVESGTTADAVVQVQTSNGIIQRISLTIHKQDNGPAVPYPTMDEAALVITMDSTDLAAALATDPDGAGYINSVTYQWQEKLLGEDSYRDIAGETNPTLTLNHPRGVPVTTKYRLLMTYTDSQGYFNTVIPADDIDRDKDGLIELYTLDDLNAIRYQLDGSGYRSSAAAEKSSAGCAVGGCIGYELVRSLSFSDDNSYADIANKVAWTVNDYEDSDDSGWQPIGSRSRPFSAILEGNHHIIADLMINRPADDDIGLFSGASGHIINVGLLNIDIRGRAHVGGLAGFNRGSITNSYAIGYVEDSLTNIGGLVGTNAGRGSITDSYANVTVTVDAKVVGGLVGSNSGRITNSYASGNIIIPREISKNGIGGLVGKNNNLGHIINSYATGAVTGNNHVGGLSGDNEGSITNSYATGVVTGNGQVGGLSGDHAGSITSSYATGRVIGKSNIVGGLTGQNIGGNITNSYATGAVSGGSLVGGLTGYNFGGGSITNSYATGAVSGGSLVGGLTAFNRGSITNSYWDGQSSRIPTSAGGSSKTKVELQLGVAQTTDADGVYYNWSNNDWDFGSNTSYPILKYAQNPNADGIRYCDAPGVPACGTPISTAGRGGLNNLVAVAGSLSPEFNPDENAQYLAYELPLDGDTNTIQLIPTATDDGATISITVAGNTQTLSSGSRSEAIALSEGINPVTIEVSGVVYRLYLQRTTPLTPLTSLSQDVDNDGLIDIATLEDLNTIGISSATLVGNYELVRDLDFDNRGHYRDPKNYSRWRDSWQSIGLISGTDDDRHKGTTCDQCFNGHFDGNGFNLINLRVDGVGNENYGLFAGIGSRGIVKNLGLLNVNIMANNKNIGALSGVNEGQIINVSVVNDIDETADVVQTSGRSGGLVGLNKGVVLNSGAILYMGGNRKAILVAVNETGGQIVNSYAGGRVDVTRNLGGTIAAENKGTIRNSYADASTSILLGAVGGGLVAENSGTITDSYARGDITGDTDFPHLVAEGGLVELNSGTISNSYAAVALSDSFSIGGLVQNNSGTVTNSYWDTNIFATSNGGIGKTTAELQSGMAQATNASNAYYQWSSANWDFGASNEYPILKYAESVNSIVACGSRDTPPCGNVLPSPRYGLRDLIAIDGSFSPPFEAQQLAARHYHGEILAPTPSIRLRPITTEAVATTTITILNSSAAAQAISNGATSAPIALNEDALTHIVVDVQGTYTARYRLLFNYTPSDIVSDGNGFVQINYLEDLDAMRYQLDGRGYRADPEALLIAGGCDAGCKGYQLQRDLDFKDADSYRSGTVNSQWTTDGWLPVGTMDAPFTAEFDGNGYEIANLKVSAQANGGLFGVIKGTARRTTVKNLGVVSIDIRGTIAAGIVARCNSCEIEHNYIIGTIVGDHTAGGVVGDGSDGQTYLSNNFYIGHLSAGTMGGGLIGLSSESTATNNYVLGHISIADPNGHAGMMVGTIANHNANQAYNLVNSFAAVRATLGNTTIATLIGADQAGNSVAKNISDSYYDADIAAVTNGGLAQPTSALQNNDLQNTTLYDEWSTSDWDFGSHNQYPALVHQSSLLPYQGGLLADLSLQSVATGLSHPFSPYRFDYQVSAGGEVDTLMLSANAVNGNAMIQVAVDGVITQSVQSGAALATIPLNYAADTMIELTVKDENNRDSYRYRLSVHHLADNVGSIDSDRDGLIDIGSVQQLNAIRYNVDGSSYKSAANAAPWYCVNGCRGYELTDDIDIGDRDWQPLGDAETPFNTRFNGNGYRIANLTITDPGHRVGALFGVVGTDARIEHLHIDTVQISDSGGGDFIAAAIAATNHGLITHSYATDIDISSNGYSGGLIGFNYGTIANSYVTRGRIQAAVAGGGLIAVSTPTATISKTYVAGVVVATTATATLGGLVGDGGRSTYPSNPAADSYYEVAELPAADTIGVAKTAAELARGGPSAALYNGWSRSDWHFGSNQQNPALLYASGDDVGDLAACATPPSPQLSACESRLPQTLSADDKAVVCRGHLKPSLSGRPYCGALLPRQRVGLMHLEISTADITLHPAFTPIADASLATPVYTAVGDLSSMNSLHIIPISYTAADRVTIVSDSTAPEAISLDESSAPIAVRNGERIVVSVAATNNPPYTYTIHVRDTAVFEDRRDIVDSDGDGLIDIYYLEHLRAMRYQLDGSGYSRSGSADKQTQGCPSNSCRGYELMRSLDFTDTASYADPSNKVAWTVDDYDAGDDNGWRPIGNSTNPFTATLEGNRYTIANLMINRPNNTNQVGLFGYIDMGHITNVGLLNVKVVGQHGVGSLVGKHSKSGTIMNSYASGVVSGGDEVGGLVGSTDGTPNIGNITNSYASVAISGNDKVGGLVGSNEFNITNSYATGTVSGGNEVGGLVGSHTLADITDSYATGAVSGTNQIGGLVGNLVSGSITNSYWDTQTSGIATGNNGSGQTTIEMQSGVGQTTDAATVYYNWSNNDWDFTPVHQYPALRYASDGMRIDGQPTDSDECDLSRLDLSDSDNNELVEIHYLEDLATLHTAANKKCVVYELMRDLDFNNAAHYRDLNNKILWTVADWDDSADNGWQPIKNLNGIFDGRRHTISNLQINRTGLTQVGLFADTEVAIIRDLTLANARVEGGERVGILVGYNRARVIGVSASGAVRGTDEIGGLIGNNQNTIINSATRGAATGKDIIGGLIGRNEGDIINSYAISTVIGHVTVGGLVGLNGGNIINSYASGAVSGRNTVGGLVGYGSDPDDTIINSYASGVVSGQRIVGGLVANSVTAITNSYASSAVSGVSQVGGLVGFNHPNVMNSYWDTQASGIATSHGGAGLITAQLQLPTSATGIYTTWSADDWDFGTNNQLPLLKYSQSCRSADDTMSRLPQCGTLLSGQPRLVTPAEGQMPTLEVELVSDDFTLLPDFATQVGEYKVSVFDDTASIELRALTSTTGTIIYLSNGNGFDRVVQNGIGQDIPLIAGHSTVIDVELRPVTGDGYLLRYRITAERLPSVILADRNDRKVDADGNGLIEIIHLEDLNAIRYQLDGSGYRVSERASKITRGCPSAGCYGYELTTDLNFNEPTSYRSGQVYSDWTSASGWQPIGTAGKPFTAVFKAKVKTVRYERIVNGINDRLSVAIEEPIRYTLLGLYINRATEDHVGLFGVSASTAEIKGIGLIGQQVHGRTQVGSLIGHNKGIIDYSYAAQGRVVGVQHVGGLVGRNDNGTIINSYTGLDVVASGNIVGGLTSGNYNDGLIKNSFSRSRVTGTCIVGGLVGENDSGLITGTYAFATVAVNSETFCNDLRLGGLVGVNRGDIANSYVASEVLRTVITDESLHDALVAENSGVIYSTYWDTTVNHSVPSANGSAFSTAELQAGGAQSNTQQMPYYQWNPRNWNFGDAADYPRLRYQYADQDIINYCQLSLFTSADTDPYCSNFPILYDPAVGLHLVGLHRFTISGIDAIQPAFDPRLYEYQILLKHGASVIFFTATTYTPYATIDHTYKGSTARITSGQLIPIIVDADDLVLTITVSAPNGSVRTYNFTIVRLADKITGYADEDGDGLIEVRNADELHAIRYQLDGSSYRASDRGQEFSIGCPPLGCYGYELAADIDLSDREWQPIGVSDEPFAAVFDGNREHYTISGLTIDNSTLSYVGLFGAISSTAHIKHLVLRAVDINAHSQVGAVVGINNGGTISDSYMAGRVSGESSIGGLVGDNRGRIENSYARSMVTINDSDGGGLVGRNVASEGVAALIINSSAFSTVLAGADDITGVGGLVGVNEMDGQIRNSYAHTNVNGSFGVGGLVGSNKQATIRDSYASGRLQFSDGDEVPATLGGLVGENDAATISNSYATVAGQTPPGKANGLIGLSINNGTIMNSYWDLDVSATLDSDGGTSKTTVQLQSGRAQSIDQQVAYYQWEIKNWYFGNSDEYPRLKYIAGDDAESPLCDGNRQPSCGAIIGPPPQYREYADADSNGLIEIHYLEDLSAMRNSLTGERYQHRYTDGVLINTTSGCPADGCVGYELLRDLDFRDVHSYQSGEINQQWISGSGWIPIGIETPFTAEFNGGGHIISNLFINSPDRHGGLFATVESATSATTISLLGLEDVTVMATAVAGGLVASLNSGGLIDRCYVTGHVEVTGTGVGSAGLLVGSAGGQITNSYTIGRVKGNGQTNVGGLVGGNSGALSNSYAAAQIIDNTGNGVLGGLVAMSSGDISGSYWDTDVSGIADDGDTIAPEGRTTMQLQNATVAGTIATQIYHGWDDSIWNFGNNNQYPMLQYQKERATLTNLTVRGGVLLQDFAPRRHNYYVYTLAGRNAEITVAATTTAVLTLSCGDNEACPTTVPATIAVNGSDRRVLTLAVGSGSARINYRVHVDYIAVDIRDPDGNTVDELTMEESSLTDLMNAQLELSHDMIPLTVEGVNEISYDYDWSIRDLTNITNLDSKTLSFYADEDLVAAVTDDTIMPIRAKLSINDTVFGE